MSFAPAASRERLEALRRALDPVREAIPAGAPVAWVGLPTHHNVGDHVIALGTLAILEERGARVVAAVPDVAGVAALRGLPADTVVVCQGGGNLGDLWPGPQRQREDVVALLPDHRVVWMPQSVFFRSARRRDEAAARLRAHPALDLFVRDPHSAHLASAMGLRPRLVPDLAHGVGPIAVPGPVDGALVLLRADPERGPEPADALALGPRHDDWRAVLGRRWSLSARLHRLRGRLGSMHALDRWRRFAEATLARATARIARHDRVVTSRLHGFLLAQLVGRPTWLLDTAHGKCTAYRDHWLGDP